MAASTAIPQSPSQPLILVFAEVVWGKLEKMTFELLADARKLAVSCKGRVEVVLFSAPQHTPALLHEFAGQVHEPVHLVEHNELAEFCARTYIGALSELLQTLRPNVCFIGATVNGRSLGPGLAARLGYAYFPHCLLIKGSSLGKLDITRVTHGGRVHVQANWPMAEPAILTMKAGVADAPAPEKTPKPASTVTRHEIPVLPRNVRVKKRLPADPKTLDIREAERLVAGGRGVGAKENFEVLVSLADAMGASVAASRAAVDLGWIEYERQVGQTGKAVSPRLYLAAGISGASHHLMGMRDSEKIVAVNVDRQAPIFSVAHFGVLGDLHAVLPKLTERIRKEKSK